MPAGSPISHAPSTTAWKTVGTTLDDNLRQRVESDTDLWGRWSRRYLRRRTTRQEKAGRHPGRHPARGVRRLSWTHRVLTDDTIALRTRVAAGMLLLFAQTITQIVKLTVEAVLHHEQDDGQDREQGVYLRLSHPPGLARGDSFSAIARGLAYQRHASRSGGLPLSGSTTARCGPGSACD